MKAIILVGGKGTRLRPLTLESPKPLLPVLNKPFFGYQLDALREAGIKNVMLAAGKNSRPWEKGLKDLKPAGIAVNFSYEPVPLGTGGAIRYAFDSFARKKIKADPGEPVFIFNGDVFFDLDVRAFFEFHRSKKAECSIALTRVDDPSRFGVVLMDSDGRVKRFIEKPQNPVGSNYVNAGAYIFNPDLVLKIPAGRPVSIEKDSYPQFLEQKIPLYGYPTDGYWNDIGTPATYLQAHRDLLTLKSRWTPETFLRKRGLQLGKHTSFHSDRSFDGQALFGDRCAVGKNVTISGQVCAGSNVRIGDDCVIRNSVLFSGARIGRGVKMNGAIIGRNCRIENFCEIKEGAVLGDETALTPYTRC